MTFVYGGGHWENVDLLGYVRRDEFLDSRRPGDLSVEDQAICITLDGRSRSSAYGTWIMRMAE